VGNRTLVATAGKDSNIYLLDLSQVWAQYNGQDNRYIYQELDGANPGGIWGGPAYFNGSLYYGASGFYNPAAGLLEQFTFDDTATLQRQPVSVAPTSFAWPGTIPSVSANGTQDGIVWAIEVPNDGLDVTTGPAVLHAYDANNLQTELFRSTLNFGDGVKFSVPTIAGGKVFVGTKSAVGVFGLPTTSSIPYTFNGTPTPGGDSIWFNVHLTKANGIPASGATIRFSGATVTSSAFTVPLPDGAIIFSPSAACATTSYSGNTWTTTVPISGSDEIFLTGLALPLPSGLMGGLNPVTVTGIFSASVPGISVSWQWGAAVYARFTTPNAAFYNSLNVKPTHQNACNPNNGDHAGAPENTAFQQCVIGGAGGGGGSNFTGGWSATVSTPELGVP
jgi:hypothetical protein